MKRDRQREHRGRVLRAERAQHAHEQLPPEQRCPRCGSRMGRFAQLAEGQKAVCGKGHVWIREERVPRKPRITPREDMPAPAPEATP